MVLYTVAVQRKVDRRSMKILILLEHYCSPSELEDRLGAFVDYYNNHRYHEALNNVTPADVYYGRDRDVVEQRKRSRSKACVYGKSKTVF